MHRRTVLKGLGALSLVPILNACSESESEPVQPRYMPMVEPPKPDAPFLRTQDFTPTGKGGYGVGSGAQNVQKPFLILYPTAPNETGSCAVEYTMLKNAHDLLNRECGAFASHVGIVAMYPDVQTNAPANLDNYILNADYPATGLKGPPQDVIAMLSRYGTAYAQDLPMRNPIIPKKTESGEVILTDIHNQILRPERIYIGAHTSTAYLFGPPDHAGNRKQLASLTNLQFLGYEKAIVAQTMQAMKEHGYTIDSSPQCSPEALIARL